MPIDSARQVGVGVVRARPRHCHGACPPLWLGPGLARWPASIACQAPARWLDRAFW
jgi:hypothetical protein